MPSERSECSTKEASVKGSNESKEAEVSFCGPRSVHTFQLRWLDIFIFLQLATNSTADQSMNESLQSMGQAVNELVEYVEALAANVQGPEESFDIICSADCTECN